MNFCNILNTNAMKVGRYEHSSEPIKIIMILLKIMNDFCNINRLKSLIANNILEYKLLCVKATDLNQKTTWRSFEINWRIEYYTIPPSCVLYRV